MSADSGILLLDTNIVSDLMKGDRGVAANRARQAIEAGRVQLLGISIVVQCELLYGLAKRPSPRLRAAYDIEMSKLEVFNLDAAVAVAYAQVRWRLEQQGTPIGPNDALIAAHALALGATLVSGDDAFERVPGLRVENWLRPSLESENHE